MPDAGNRFLQSMPYNDYFDTMFQPSIWKKRVLGVIHLLRHRGGGEQNFWMTYLWWIFFFPRENKMKKFDDVISKGGALLKSTILG